MVNVAILGFGVVGSGVAEVLTQNSAVLEKKLGKKINIKHIFPTTFSNNLIQKKSPSLLRDFVF